VTWLVDLKDHYLQLTQMTLLLNGLGDLVLGLSLLLTPEQLSKLLNLQYMPEIQYLAGGWGISTLALGGWRTLASRSNNWQNISATVYLGLFEGGLLSIFGILMVVLGKLSLQQVSMGLLFSAFFALAYVICIVKSR
jgi:hypothetical protein